MSIYDRAGFESSDTTDASDTTDDIREFPYWLTEPGEEPRFLGTHWQWNHCDMMSSLNAENIRHKDDCPIGGREVEA